METLCKSRLAILALLPAKPSLFPLFYPSTVEEERGDWPPAAIAYFESLYALWINILLIDAPETEADRIRYFIAQSAELLHDGAAPHPISRKPHSVSSSSPPRSPSSASNRPGKQPAPPAAMARGSPSAPRLFCPPPTTCAPLMHTSLLSAAHAAPAQRQTHHCPACMRPQGAQCVR
jgi:hypothetical protein